MILCISAGWRNFDDDGPGIEKWVKKPTFEPSWINPLIPAGG